MISCLCQVQGAVTTLGYLRGTFAAIERINSVLSTTEVDEPLAYGLEKELKLEDLKDDKPLFIYKDDYSSKILTQNKHYMYKLRSVANGCNLAWSGDICLEGIILYICWKLLTLSFICFGIRICQPFYKLGD